MQSLGLDVILVRNLGAIDDQAAALAEIDENFARNDLNALDRAVFVDKRKKLLEVAGFKHGGNRKTRIENAKIQGANMASWISDHAAEAERIGISHRTFQRSASLMAKLAPGVIDTLRGTALADNQAALLALSRMPAEQQVAIAAIVRERGIKSLSAAKQAAGVAAAPPADPVLAAMTRIQRDLALLGARDLDQVATWVKSLISAKRRTTGG